MNLPNISDFLRLAPVRLIECLALKRVLLCRYYPYHYAPMCSDVAKFTKAVGQLKHAKAVTLMPVPSPEDSWGDSRGPVRPLVQLMAVLPPKRQVPDFHSYLSLFWLLLKRD